ncbi:MAG: sulfatase [Planctomycetaceae bacterium]|nr:sulfatase [Planctomycetaceae bacterium]
MSYAKLLLAALTLLVASSLQAADSRPNIVWIIVDDMSANFSCYGETTIETPHVDRMAREGVKFTNAYVTAPVCSTCRSAFITGMYQTSIGAHHHRSGRGDKKIVLLEGIQPVPKLFQEAGYHTSIGSWPGRKNRKGKTDYNFEWDPSMYDSADWSGHKPGQPFFHQIQTSGGKMRGGNRSGAQKLAARAKEQFGAATKPSDVTLPPYYPRDEVILEDWAAYLDSVRFTDLLVGEVLARLAKENILDNTLVVFMTDHGISHARGKQFLYEEGLHVPLVIRGPRIAAGATREDLVEHIDIAALSLAAAGIPIPDYMQARDVFSKAYEPRDAIFAARDRCDETVEHLRCVRTERYKYIRNFLPARPYLQPNAYKDKKSILVALRAAHAAGRLNDAQSLILAESRPAEELYDLQADPHEIKNLASDPKHSGTLRKLRGRLDRWIDETDDHGRDPETPEMYDSDMTVYVNTLKARKGDPEHLKRIEDNIALMKKWASEGK